MQPPAPMEGIAKTALEEEDDTTYRDNVTAAAMKEYEAATKLVVSPNKMFIIRLDGHRFSKFTKGFKRPYDERTMHRTTADLLVYFSCRLGYTQSDEITLVFPAAENRTTLSMESFRRSQHSLQEFNTGFSVSNIILDSYGTARFIAHMSAQVFGANEAELKEKVGFAHFDARVFTVPSASEALRNIWWRQNDCKCNSKLNLGAANLKQRELENLSPAQIVRKLRTEHKIEWRDMPGPYKWGAFLKKGKVMKEGFNPKTNEHIPAVERSVMMIAAFSIDGVTERNEVLVTSKVANEVPHLFVEFHAFEH